MILQGYLLTDLSHHPSPGWVRVEGDRIVEVGGGIPSEKPDLGGTNYLICPGFIDAHIHIPQIDSVGYDGLDLLDWLERVIFPAEARWDDSRVVDQQIRSAQARMLRSGTLGYAGYLTSHISGLEWFCNPGDRHSPLLRAMVGQVLMDRNAPRELCGHRIMTPSTLSPDPRTTFSLNPRFAVACTSELLEEAGRMAQQALPDGSLPLIQTHLAENTRECELVRELFPADPHYTAVYDRCGLLGPHTLLAHALHLVAEEWALIADRESVVVHCPTANTFLRSGLFNLRATREHDIRLALGSDLAAGPDIAMPRVARAMIEVAKLRALTLDSQNPIPTPAEAWDMITCGNADALNWPDAGRLDAGAGADLLLLRVPFEIDDHLYGRLIYTWRDDYIAERIVNGCVLDDNALSPLSA